MRILQVLTQISLDGAYGGVARVALNQSSELARRGHQVTIAATGASGLESPPECDGVTVRLFAARTLVPRTGFSGLVAPSMMRWFHSHRTEFDVVHIHLARELVPLSVAVLSQRYGVPYVVQPHGMVIPSAHPLSGTVDRTLTRRVLRNAGAVCHLTELERTQLGVVGRTPLRFVHLPNGVPLYPPAHASAGTPEVICTARLHRRKRPTAFVEMARSVLAAGVDARFTLIGPDAGEGAAVRAAIADHDRIAWRGALAPDDIPERLASAAVYILPSVQEPYPMAVLEAMSVGLPVVVTDDCGLAPLVARTHSGIVAGPSVPALSAAVRTLLADPALASAMGRRGRETVKRDHSMVKSGETLATLYADLLGGPP